MPPVRPNILFCMRYPDSEGFVWKTVARLRDLVAGALPGRECLIAFPQLTGRSAHHFAHLEPVEIDCYRLAPADREALARLVAERQIGGIVYMSALPATLDLRFLRQLGLITINTEEDSFDPAQRNPLPKAAAKYVLRRVLKRQLHDLHIANSRAQGQWLERFAKIPPERLVTIPNGVDTGYFVPAEPPPPAVLPAGKRWVIWVSQARAEKRVGLILRCAAQLAALPEYADVGFVYVGDGELLGEWQQQAAALGLRDRIVFAGQQADLRPWYHSAALMVHAAERESFGLVLAEAMACALPVVASEAAGPRGIIAHEQTGLLVPIGTADAHEEAAFSAAMARYLSDPALARAHGLAGRARACALFSIHRQAADFAAAIERVVPFSQISA